MGKYSHACKSPEINQKRMLVFPRSACTNTQEILPPGLPASDGKSPACTSLLDNFLSVGLPASDGKSPACTSLLDNFLSVGLPASDGESPACTSLLDNFLSVGLPASDGDGVQYVYLFLITSY